MKKKDCPMRIKKSVKLRLDKLDFVTRHETYSQTIDTLISFYEKKKNGKERKK